MPLPITPHFTLDEWTCKDGTIYPSAWIPERLAPLCQVLEVIRTACGDRPITILCGFRSPSYNAKLIAQGHHGVASGSQHVEGRAADITVAGMAPSDVHAAILALEADGQVPQLGGLGIYPGWVHVDVRPRVPAGHLARWSDLP